MFAALTVATITVLLLYLLKIFKTCTDFSEVITAVQQNARYIGLVLFQFYAVASTVYIHITHYFSLGK